MKHLKRLGRGRNLIEQRVLNGTEDEREWSAQFVAYVAEERSLGAIEIGQLFSPLFARFHTLQHW